MAISAGAMPPASGKETGAAEHVGCLCVEGEPPGEQLPGRVDLDADEIDPRRAQRRLMPEHARRPLRCRPHEAECQDHSGDGLQNETAAR